MQKSIHSRDYKAFLKLLRAERLQANLTQEQLAHLLGATQSYISKVERGERRVDVAELRAFCEAFGTSLSEFACKLDATWKHAR